MNGKMFAKFIEENFQEMFVKSRKPNTRKFTQDNNVIVQFKTCMPPDVP